MRKLILIKHSLPEMVPEVSARDWQLNAEGRRRCEPLADWLVSYQPLQIIASREPKAVETAELVATRLGLPVEVADDLHEHDRSNVGLLPAEQIRGLVAEFFRNPAELVFGRETARQAQARFRASVERSVAAQPAGNLAIVAHGTVITLLVASYSVIEPYAFWQRLGLPAAVVLSLPGYQLEEVVEEFT